MENESVNSKPFTYTMSLIGGKWKMQILFWLWKSEIEGITHKMLSNQLKELENDRLIIRTEYPQVPPKVEYKLSERGKTLMPVLHSVCHWGIEHMEDKV